jgi:hypothetical protein
MNSSAIDSAGYGPPATGYRSEHGSAPLARSPLEGEGMCAPGTHAESPLRRSRYLYFLANGEGLRTVSDRWPVAGGRSPGDT